VGKKVNVDFRNKLVDAGPFGAEDMADIIDVPRGKFQQQMNRGILASTPTIVEHGKRKYRRFGVGDVYPLLAQAELCRLGFDPSEAKRYASALMSAFNDYERMMAVRDVQLRYRENNPVPELRYAFINSRRSKNGVTNRSVVAANQTVEQAMLLLGAAPAVIVVDLAVIRERLQEAKLRAMAVATKLLNKGQTAEDKQRAVENFERERAEFLAYEKEVYEELLKKSDVRGKDK